jgi:sporulation protein YlmC with PRC-barrel domain
MHSTQDILGWRGRDVVDRDGEKLGSLSEVYLDAETDQPAWFAVRTGLFGARSSFVPVEGAELEGDAVCVAYPKAQVKDAPAVDPDGQLEPAEEDRLYEHYGVTSPDADARDERGATDAPDERGPTGGPAGAVTGGMEGHEDEPTSPQARRPRIRRHITEEIGEDGEVIRRETRTEETFS